MTQAEPAHAPTTLRNDHGDPFAELWRPPHGEALPILVSVPHHGERLTQDAIALLDEANTPGLRHEMLQDVDRFTADLWADARGAGATVLCADMHRYVVDLNRAPDDFSPEAVQGAAVKNAPGYYGERGVIWARTTRRTPVWTRALTQAEAAARVAAWHAPYHAALRAELDRLLARFGRVALIDAHSMPSQGRAGHGDTGRPRPDVNPGTVNGQACTAALRDAVVTSLQRADLEVRVDDPYKGGWITRHYGQPNQGVEAIQIELNRALYMDEESCDPKPAAIAALAPAMAQVVHAAAAVMGAASQA